MLTYNFENMEGPIYERVYKCIKNDIISGNIKPGYKLPSKRTFANNHGISTITIQNAYDQLISEGYIYTRSRVGYFVSNIEGMPRKATISGHASYDIKIPREDKFRIDFSGNGCSTDNFPFSVWTKVSREIMSTKKNELMEVSPVCGIEELRQAISEHLKSFRGMIVDPNQIIIGAGTEYLYGLLTELLGTKRVYTIENPGYKKLVQIYAQRGISCKYAALDENGVTVGELNRTKADVAHICPNHHFPTGITMPASRRYEILAWACEKQNRYIIEDDYDSEFRTEGKPIPTLFSIDESDRVIYMNTFSKSLSPTIRISYMILPVPLVKMFYDKMSFYSCSVSNFEQYTLASFINQGYFEKHINRMRLYYMRKRRQIIDIIQNSPISDKCKIIENDSGLHFLVQIETKLSPEEIKVRLLNSGIRMQSLSDYYLDSDRQGNNMFIINYSNVDIENIKESLPLFDEIFSS